MSTNPITVAGRYYPWGQEEYFFDAMVERAPQRALDAASSVSNLVTGRDRYASPQYLHYCNKLLRHPPPVGRHAARAMAAEYRLNADYLPKERALWLDKAAACERDYAQLWPEEPAPQRGSQPWVQAIRPWVAGIFAWLGMLPLTPPER